MNRAYPDRPFAAVGAIVLRKRDLGPDSEIMLVRRDNEPAKGKWSIPGGAIELGETAREAARREVREECGVDIRPIEVFDVFDSLVLDDGGRVVYHYVIVDFLAEAGEGELRPKSDAAEAGWFTLRQAARLDLTRGTESVIGRLIEMTGAPEE